MVGGTILREVIENNIPIAIHDRVPAVLHNIKTVMNLW